MAAHRVWRCDAARWCPIEIKTHSPAFFRPSRFARERRFRHIQAPGRRPRSRFRTNSRAIRRRVCSQGLTSPRLKARPGPAGKTGGGRPAPASPSAPFVLPRPPGGHFRLLAGSGGAVLRARSRAHDVRGSLTRSAARAHARVHCFCRLLPPGTTLWSVCGLGGRLVPRARATRANYLRPHTKMSRLE